MAAEFRSAAKNCELEVSVYGDSGGLVTDDLYRGCLMLLGSIIDVFFEWDGLADCLVVEFSNYRKSTFPLRWDDGGISPRDATAEGTMRFSSMTVTALAARESRRYPNFPAGETIQQIKREL